MTERSGPVTLGIDIGGSGLKAGRLDPSGRLLGERARTPTPQPARPAAVVEAQASDVRAGVPAAEPGATLTTT